MGVITEDGRTGMHWQQSPRFPCGPPILGAPRELSPTLPGPPSNNNHPPHRPCSGCPEGHSINDDRPQNCDHRTSDCDNTCEKYHRSIHNSMQTFNSYTNCEQSSNTIFCNSDNRNTSFNDTVRSSGNNSFTCSENSRGSTDNSRNLPNGFSDCRNELDNPSAFPPRDSCRVSFPDINRDCSGGYNEERSGYSGGLGLNDHGECIGGLQPKIEPPGSQSPSGDDSSCAGCGRHIQDRFYLSAVERRWHALCLQCCLCHQPLEGETSCFARDGNIYCKNDYYRIFGTRRCARCLAAISSSELVMRARHLVFHVRCFSCAMCSTPLTKGDHFGMRESAVLCRLHYEVAMETGSHFPPVFPPSFPSPPLAPPTPGTDSPIKAGPPFFPAAPSGPPRQKGRPRKRKPKDLEAMTANLDLNSDYLDLGGFGRSPGSHMGGSSRAKRMRTSFKHHQLRTMKSYFAINHNPDAKDLKQLSQKTGLPKRVLQVWFQNARAKWRRLMLKQEGKSGDKSLEGGSLDLESYAPHSPNFLLGGPPSPHSID